MSKGPEVQRTRCNPETGSSVGGGVAPGEVERPSEHRSGGPRRPRGGLQPCNWLRVTGSRGRSRVGGDEAQFIGCRAAGIGGSQKPPVHCPVSDPAAVRPA